MGAGAGWDREHGRVVLMPAPLENFLRLVTSGNVTLTPEMYAHFGGGDILKELQKYDPNAAFSEVRSGPDSDAMGMRLDVDLTKLPKSDRGMAGFDLNPSNLHENLKTNKPVAHDSIYGDVRNSGEFADDSRTLLETLGPLFVSMVAPMAGGALAGAGIGGGTAAVTGSGLGGAASIPGWAAQGIKALPSLARQVDNGGLNLMSILSLLAGPAAGAAGVNPNLVKGALTLAQLAKGRP